MNSRKPQSYAKEAPSIGAWPRMEWVIHSWKNENGTLELHGLKTVWFSFDRNDGASEAYLTGFVMSESAAMACFSDEE